MAHSDLVQSLLKGLSILDLLAQAERGMTLQEVCRLLDLRQPTAYNLLRTLVARNYVERTPAPVRYRLGRTVIRLADDLTRQDLVNKAGGALRGLYKEVLSALPREPGPEEEVAVSFAKALGGEVRLLLRIRNDSPQVLAKPMSVMNPYRSTSSLVYQAYWSREERDGYRRAHPFAEFGLPVWKTERKLNLALHEVRTNAYAHPDIYGSNEYRLSVPVFDAGHVLVGVVGVGAWMRLNRLAEFRILRQAVATAASLSQVPHPAKVTR